jgi:predicted metal-binding membrane protein
MTSAPAVRARPPWWVRTAWHHPEWAIAAVAVAAWAVVVVDAADHGSHTAAPSMIVVMTVAMMAPSVLPPVRALALSGPWRRRYRAQVAFTGAYLGAWAAVALVLGGLAAFVPPEPWIPSAALLVAAVWEVSAPKRRFLRACHRLSAPTGRGRRADAACARAGLRNAAACMGACWALMTAMVLSTSLALMLLLTAVATAGKVLRQGPRLGPESAAALVVAAVYTAVL